MEDSKNKEMEDALSAISSMIEKSEKAQQKFAKGTSQYTLLRNRRKALYIASSLIAKELKNKDVVAIFTKEDFHGALAPINSLISKSEKAQTKLADNTWQYRMLAANLKALYLALPLLMKALDEFEN
ncbi:hypothetical protein [Clostridium sp. Marseille-P299]|uniref:hypothetical protein n=1 Tax=Clostridium sp. Marseille-P299 TaxID=1805477 RepID=UPI000834D3C9|nr:hypothetical protein [Clostridium sp. Marseille-P299]